VLRAHPSNTCDEPIAAGSPHQIGNLGTAFVRGTDYEPICNKDLEFRMGLRIADNASEQAPITKNPLALGDGRADIANGGFPIRRHHNIPQYSACGSSVTFPPEPSTRYPVADIPAALLTHVIYTFANVTAAGDCVSESAKDDAVNFPQIARTQIKFPAAPRVDIGRRRFSLDKFFRRLQRHSRARIL
jgi:hypothetical protein